MVLQLHWASDQHQDSIVNAIKGVIAADVGTCASQGADCSLGGHLLIRQTPAVHRQIQELLSALKRPAGPQDIDGGGMGGFSAVRRRSVFDLCAVRHWLRQCRS